MFSGSGEFSSWLAAIPQAPRSNDVTKLRLSNTGFPQVRRVAASRHVGMSFGASLAPAAHRGGQFSRNEFRSDIMPPAPDGVSEHQAAADKNQCHRQNRTQHAFRDMGR